MTSIIIVLLCFDQFISLRSLLYVSLPFLSFGFPLAGLRIKRTARQVRGRSCSTIPRGTDFRPPGGATVEALSWRHPPTLERWGAETFFRSSLSRIGALSAQEPCWHVWYLALQLWRIKKPRAMDGAEYFRHGWRPTSDFSYPTQQSTEFVRP